MKRIVTLLLAVTAIAARATDYNVPITVSVNGEISEQTGVITVEQNDGRYDLTVKNFLLQSENGPMGVGNVEVKAIDAIQDGNATLLLANREVVITPGDDPNVVVWLADMLPPVPVDLRGKIEDGRLRCFLDIDMMQMLGQKIQVGIGVGYQMPNQSFEGWHTSAGDYVEPNGWHSFESATGALAPLAGHHIEKSDDAHTGQASARIYATSIFGIVANGTMTTGRMNAGAMVAADASNHAYLDTSLTDVDGNGDPFYVPLYTRPDSLALWVKFSQGTTVADHPYATVSAVITDGTRYQDPEDKAYTNVIAKAANNTIATTDGQWVRIAAPFVYTDNTAEPKAILVTISTNADPGQGSANDEVLVDDIQLIYNADVTAITIKGTPLHDFTPAKTDYETELNQTLTPDDIEVATPAPHVLKTVTTEDDHYICTVTAISADMSALATYVIKVKSSATAITDPSTIPAAPATHYTLDGRRITTPTLSRIHITRHPDGTTKKVIR